MEKNQGKQTKNKVTGSKKSNKNTLKRRLLGIIFIAAASIGGIFGYNAHNQSKQEEISTMFGDYSLSQRSPFPWKDVYNEEENINEENQTIGTLNCIDGTRDFCIIDIQNAKKPRDISEYFKNPDSNTQFGLLLKSEAKTQEEYNKDLKYLKSFLEEYDITYPCFIDISSLNLKKGLFNKDEKLSGTEILNDITSKLSGFCYLYGSQKDFQKLNKLWEKGDSNFDATNIPKALKVEPGEYVENIPETYFLVYPNGVIFSQISYKINDDNFEKKLEKYF